jgi:hypothetical protein
MVASAMSLLIHAFRSFTSQSAFKLPTAAEVSEYVLVVALSLLKTLASAKDDDCSSGCKCNEHINQCVGAFMDKGSSHPSIHLNVFVD